MVGRKMPFLNPALLLLGQFWQYFAQMPAQIHAISDEIHRQIHPLLTDHQKELEKAMRRCKQNGKENRRPAPPAAKPPDPSLSIA